jgi:cell division protein FtsL
MTVLGKILVIVNLVFSLVTGFLIVMVYATRTNWHTAYAKVVAERQTVEAASQKVRDDAESTRKGYEAQIAALKQEVDQLKGDLAGVTTESTRRQTEIGKHATRAQVAGANSNDAVTETKRLREEVEKLQDDVGQRDQKVHEYEKTVKDLTDKKVLAELAYKSEHDRNTGLLDQVANLSRDLERAKTRGGSGGGSSSETVVRKPPEDVKGRVLDVDPKTGLVTISLGSDAGIAKGQTLEVYRTWPEAKYLGTVQILDANHHEAVARPMTRQPRGVTIQKGDTVASSILGPR